MSNEINLFEYATRYDVRFQTVKGVITVGQLWDLPLRSAKQPGFDLDTVARTVNDELKKLTTESFVDDGGDSSERTHYQIALDIVKHIIAVKKQENAERLDDSRRAAEKERLIAILADKQDNQLKDLSVEEIQARLADLTRK